jgi:hypothetical protein
MSHYGTAGAKFGVIEAKSIYKGSFKGLFKPILHAK